MSGRPAKRKVSETEPKKFKTLVEGNEAECTRCWSVEKILFDNGTDKLCKVCTFAYQVEDEEKCPYKVYQCQAYCTNKFVILKDSKCPECHEKGLLWKPDWVNDATGAWVPPQWDLDTPYERYNERGYKKGSCVCGWEGLGKCQLNLCECDETAICDYRDVLGDFFLGYHGDSVGDHWWKRPLCEDCLHHC